MILLWCAMEYVSLHFLLQCFSFALHNTFVHYHLPLIHFFPFSFLDKYSFNTNVTVHNFGPLLRFEAHVYQLLSSCIISSKQLQPVHTSVVEVGCHFSLCEFRHSHDSQNVHCDLLGSDAV